MRSSKLTLALAAIVAAFLLSFFPANVVAQDKAVSEAPVVWERYKASGRNESVLLPKLPTAVSEQSFCSDLYIQHYYAYAEDVVYEFTVAYKGKMGNYTNCSRKRFGQGLLDERLTQLSDEKLKNAQTMESINGGDTYVFASDTASTWIFPDIKNNHWLELAILHRPGVKIDGSKFTGSIDLAGGQGKDIGEGSSVTLGDAGVDTSVIEPDGPKKDVGDQLRILTKPRAAYTELARRNSEKGTVVVKVPFLANGGIGHVTVVKVLNYGLTEQATAAAKKIVFLPKRVNGVPVTVVKTVEYSFSIY